MIVRNNASWLELLFSWRGCNLPDIWGRLIAVTILSVGVTIHHELLKDTKDAVHVAVSPLPFTFMALALSIFLGFRNNEAYGRYWEGRILWGRLTNVMRTIGRQILTMIDDDMAPGQERSSRANDNQQLRAFKHALVYRLIAYVHALRNHLREMDPRTEFEGYLPPDEIADLAEQRNIPNALLYRVGDRLMWAWQHGWLNNYTFQTIDLSLVELTTVQGGCERIKHTPLPFTYTVLLHRIVACYCFFLPFGIVKDVGILTPLVVLLISYAFFGLDAIGDEIEDPFGTEANDLPLNAISRNIEINLRQALGERDLPPPLEPEDHVLL
jgi:putative membrane protein